MRGSRLHLPNYDVPRPEAQRDSALVNVRSSFLEGLTFHKLLEVVGKITGLLCP